eukprot:7379713-Prymnesium_polylepis.1
MSSHSSYGRSAGPSWTLSTLDLLGTFGPFGKFPPGVFTPSGRVKDGSIIVITSGVWGRPLWRDGILDVQRVFKSPTHTHTHTHTHTLMFVHRPHSEEVLIRKKSHVVSVGEAERRELLELDVMPVTAHPCSATEALLRRRLDVQSILLADLRHLPLVAFRCKKVWNCVGAFGQLSTVKN